MGLRHNVYALTGDAVTKDTIFRTLEYWRGNVIDYAAHSDADAVYLSDGGELHDKDIAAINRMSRARINFFNSCHSARLAHYSVAHGCDFAMFSTIEVDDPTSYQRSIAFYNALPDREDGAYSVADLLAAFVVADPGDGTFGYAISAKLLTGQLPPTFALSKWQVLVLAGIAALSTILSLAALWQH
jgi:hypothetical protein